MTPSPAQILAIRAEWDEGRLNARAWAEALDCSLETVRRIGRRDTYREVGRAPTARQARELPPQPREAEPSPEEIARSLERLRALREAMPQTADEAVKELKGDL